MLGVSLTTQEHSILFRREAVQLGTVEVPHVMPYENHIPLTLCRGLKQPLAEIWPELKLIL